MKFALHVLPGQAVMKVTFSRASQIAVLGREAFDGFRKRHPGQAARLPEDDAVTIDPEVFRAWGEGIVSWVDVERGLLHEVAHMRVGSRNPPHGPEFIRIALSLFASLYLGEIGGDI